MTAPRSELARLGLLALLVTAGVSLAGAARAVLPLSFTNPVPDGVCASVDVASQMSDPNTFAASGAGITVRQCTAACNLAEAECKQFVRVNAACENAVFSRDEQFADASCDITGATPLDRRTCRLTVHGLIIGARDGNRAAVVSAIADCDVWGDNCRTDCAGM